MPLLTSTAYAATAQFRGNIGTMIVDAAPVVKLVLLVLFIFSIFSWGIIIQRWIMFTRARKRSKAILDVVAKGSTMAKIKEAIGKAGECPVTMKIEKARRV
jgi:biopolymer transport protein TolQ